MVTLTLYIEAEGVRVCSGFVLLEFNAKTTKLGVQILFHASHEWCSTQVLQRPQRTQVFSHNSYHVVT